MKRLDAISLVGLLLRDRNLRCEFSVDRGAVLDALAVDPDDREFALQIDAKQLDIQAGALIHKRQGEVAALIPGTWRNLAGDAPGAFNRYVDQSPWPTGHRRHQMDAERFCQFLKHEGDAGYLRSEHHWMQFLVGDQRFAFRLVSDCVIQDRRRWAVQVCYRRHGSVRRKAYRIRRPSTLLRSVSR